MKLFSLFITYFLFYLPLNAQSISTLGLVQNNDDEGVMFDVLIKNDVVLSGITAQLTTNSGNYNIHIYYKVGSFNSPVSAPTTIGDWTFLASTGSFVSDAAGNPTVIPLGGATAPLVGGTTYGFYLENVLNGNDIALNEDIVSGSMAEDNAIATIFSGYEIDGDRSGSISFSGLDNPNRTFIGELFFSSASNVSQIPTIGQWGMIVLTLLFLIIGLVALNHRTTLLKRLKILER